MLALYVVDPWPSFYAKGMKSWEIRSYPTDYRGDVLIVSSHTNKVVCKMTLKDCVPLTKELWEMHFDKHRTSCGFERLPYRQKTGTAYAWALSEAVAYKEVVEVSREGKKPYHMIDDILVVGMSAEPIVFKSERLACKFLGDTMLIYWIKKNYFALVCISDLTSGRTEVVTDEINKTEILDIMKQLNASDNTR